MPLLPKKDLSSLYRQIQRGDKLIGFFGLQNFDGETDKPQSRKAMIGYESVDENDKHGQFPSNMAKFHSMLDKDME